MKTKHLNSAFFTTTGASVLVFIYLIFIGYDSIKTVKDVIKIVASILFPIPVLLFVRCLVIEHFMPKNSSAYIIKNKKPATLILISTTVSVAFLLKAIELITHKTLADQLIFAHLINSSTISSYILNYILYNNLKTNGLLSGLLMALAIHVFFLST